MLMVLAGAAAGIANIFGFFRLSNFGSREPWVLLLNLIF